MLKKSFIFTLLIAMAPLILSAETASSPEGPAFYVVKPGDCLWNISKHLWADPLQWPLLFAANKNKINNPNLIYSGQKFVLPTDLSNLALKKAERLAQSRVEPLSGWSGSSDKRVETADNRKKASATSREETVSAGAGNPASPEQAKSVEKPENEANMPAAAGPTSAAPANGLFTKILLLIVTVLVLIAGIFLWKRRSLAGGTPAQPPKPLSSFPQSDQPTASRPSFPPSPASNRPVTPAPTQPKAPPEPREWSGTITSISPPTPSTPTGSIQPNQGPAVQPRPQEPSVPGIPPGLSSTEAPSQPPSPAPQPGKEDKPSDSNTPPNSGHSAA